MSSETSKPARQVSPGAKLTLLLGALTAFGPMSIDMYLPSLPSIQAELGTDAAGAELTLSAFLLGMALGQVFYGPLSDRVGRRPPLLIGVIVFVSVSIGCAFAQSIESLILLRFLQALGACVGQVLARTVVTDIYDRREAARMFSLLMLVMGLAPILAPMFGGWILSVASWRGIFVVLASFGVVIGTIVMLRLPESRPQHVADHAKTESPFRAILSVATNRQIVGYAVAGGMNTASMFTYIAASPDLLIKTYGIPPQYYGMIFGMNAFGLIAASQVNRALLKRHTSHHMLQVGIRGGLAIALGLLVLALTGFGGLLGILVPLFLLITCMGFALPNGMASAMTIDLKRGGTTSAFVGSVQFVLGAIASAVVGTLHDGTAIPMAAVIAGALVLGNLTLTFVVGRPPAILAE
ncbi:MAG: Bcr/CflA family efflux MFS transporter [Alphaproteobacteria bacterium]|nr:Bcr/CflA family efflux MFS transporter [Alphaproteobacteria bacterium]